MPVCETSATPIVWAVDSIPKTSFFINVLWVRKDIIGIWWRGGCGFKYVFRPNGGMDPIDFIVLERKWQAAWYDKRVFEPASEGEKKWFFTVPYPYVSGLLHVGHGRTYTNGDVLARYKRMAGFNVLWPLGFHITGTPVLAVSQKIESGDEATLKMFTEHVSIYEKDASRVKEIVESFKDPWKLVNYFSGKLVNDFKAMGYSLDLSRQFTTGDREYNKFIEWQFKKFKEKGFLKQAAYPVLYSPRDGNAVGEDDIKDADTVPVEVQEFTALKFAFGDAFLVSATLRPDTLYGITNMFVNPEAEYALVQVTFGDGSTEKWWVSKFAAEKLSYQDAAVQTLQTQPGEFFVGKSVTEPNGRTVPVLPAKFVDAGHATGFVHSVPAHAPFDLVAIEELKHDEKTLSKYPGLRQAVAAIAPIPLIKLEGYGAVPAADIVSRLKISNTREKDKLEKATKELYKAEFYGGVLNDANGEFSGLSVADAKEKMGSALKAQGKARSFYETSRLAQTRSGDNVVCAVLKDQWFLDYNSPGWKALSRECLDAMDIYPALYRKQFSDVFDWLDKRPCARRRGLGTQLPFNNEWIIESLSDSTIYMAFYTLIKPVREYGLKPEQLTETFFDFVLQGRGTATEAAASALTTPDVVGAIRKEFLYWYPNNLRHTAIAHISNHLSFFVFAHTAIFGREHWPKAISLNELVISEGTKMSKSKGNVVLLNKIASEVGADVFRLYMIGASDFGSVMDYRSSDVTATRKSIQRFYQSIVAMAGEARQPTSDGVAFKWMTSKFEAAVRDSTKALEEKRLRDYVQSSFYGLLNAYDHFVRRATPGERASFARLAAVRWVKLLAPVTPHICEELHAMLDGNGFVSQASWPQADESKISPEAEMGEDLVATVLADVRKVSALLASKGKKNTMCTIIVAAPAKWLELSKLLSLGSVEAAVAKASTPELANFVSRSFFEYKSRGIGAVQAFDEQGALSAAAEFLSRELGLQVTVVTEAESRNEKAARAMPLRPAIVLA